MDWFAIVKPWFYKTPQPVVMFDVSLPFSSFFFVCVVLSFLFLSLLSCQIGCNVGRFTADFLSQVFELSSYVFLQNNPERVVCTRELSKIPNVIVHAFDPHPEMKSMCSLLLSCSCLRSDLLCSSCFCQRRSTGG
jgi:hypothetical protein